LRILNKKNKIPAENNQLGAPMTTEQTRIAKKEVASMAGTSLRTMQRHQADWRWINQCRVKCSGRPTYNRERIREGLRARGL
jgi:hypothetical protein